MSDVVLAIAGELRLDAVLDHLVHAARELVSARYAALGLHDEDGTEFDQFLHAGMSDELVAELGPLPRTHGMLGAMLADPRPFRTADITQDPRFRGWWPDAHPRMRSFLGVPIVAKGDIIGAFYLTDKEGDGAASSFSEADEQLIGVLAAHAAIAIENARLFEASRELSVIEERNRLARELHDAMTQNLFSLVLTAEAAVGLVRAEPVVVDVEASDGGVTITVRDDGVGFDPAARAIRERRLGLTSMRERAEALAGTLTVESVPGAGTTVRATVPGG